MSAEVELKPCPFCGGKAEYEGLYVYCTKCYVRMPNEPDEAEAITAWNTRHSDREGVIEECARVAENGCLVPPDGGSPTNAERELCESIAAAIRSLAGRSRR